VTADPTPATRVPMPASAMPEADAPARLRASNRRTAFTLVSIAVVFFFGIIATKFMGGPATGIGVVGAAVLLYLVVAIGRNLRDKR
jgi:small neutral amino acid transporter SnatA (MarC family)